MKEFTHAEICTAIPAEHWPVVNKWLARGDGIAIYQNVDMGHPGAGHRQFVSFGSKACQLEVETPPERLPDIGGAINWRYQLEGTYRGEELTEVAYANWLSHDFGYDKEELRCQRCQIQKTIGGNVACFVYVPAENPT